jgi:hypothetical protein
MYSFLRARILQAKFQALKNASGSRSLKSGVLKTCVSGRFYPSDFLGWTLDTRSGGAVAVERVNPMTPASNIFCSLDTTTPADDPRRAALRCERVENG